jgi:peptidoglycan biosynthesis protein MviN/MurJ (putative lipid II flippase)
VLITAFYGSRISGGETSLALLSWTLIPLMVAAVLAQVLFSAGKQAIDLRVNIISTAINVPANLLLIPRLGAAGAALAVLLSMSVYAALQYRWTRQHVTDPEAIPFLGKILAVSLASVMITAMLLRTNAIAAATAGLATYAVTVIVAGLVSRQEIDGWRTMVGSVGSRYLWGVRGAR